METNVIDTMNTSETNGENEVISYVNISERHKTFLWLWNKTGTSHMKSVLKYFGFVLYAITKDGLIKERDHLEQVHTCSLFPGHENYKMMVSARNPYSRFVSNYRFSVRPKKFNPREFESYTTKSFQQHFHAIECGSFHQRKPDYWVRVEHMYEDYMQKIGRAHV